MTKLFRRVADLLETTINCNPMLVLNVVYLFLAFLLCSADVIGWKMFTVKLAMLLMNTLLQNLFVLDG